MRLSPDAVLAIAGGHAATVTGGLDFYHED